MSLWVGEQSKKNPVDWQALFQEAIKGVEYEDDKFTSIYQANGFTVLVSQNSRR